MLFKEVGTCGFSVLLENEKNHFQHFTKSWGWVNLTRPGQEAEIIFRVIFLGPESRVLTLTKEPQTTNAQRCVNLTFWSAGEFWRNLIR